IDENLVKAQETRRILDRLYGYSVSPILWKKVGPRLSAGRVQSVAMRLLVERERERQKFRSAQYSDLKAVFGKRDNPEASKFQAELTHLGSKRVASGKDFMPESGTLDPKADVAHLDLAAAEKLRDSLLKLDAAVTNVEEKPYTTRPSPPFTTSTLQQEASRKLGYAVKRTMSVAQLLYENGVITYMRTDSTTLSEEALTAARSLIKRDFGPDFLFPEPRLYKTKVKNAQEAHEAIRPAGAEFTPPSEVRQRYGEEAFRLYELIWKRTVASQMKDAQGTRIAVEIHSGEARFRASGKTITFAGFLRAYVEGSDDPEADLADQEKILPALSVGELLKTLSIEALEHETQPPARFTEGTLIKELERLGIGRPSTWATIVDVVLSRDYAFKRGPALVPTFLAYALTNLMVNHFYSLLDYEFTARLEDDLDAISRGEANNINYLRTFYFGNGHPGLKNLVASGEEKIDPRLVNGIPIGKTESGVDIEVRIGRFGPFLSDGTNRASVPPDLAPDELNMERALQILADAAKGPEVLGKHPQSGEPIYLKKGRFGPYLQLGDQVEDGPKPKMSSLLPSMSPESVSFEDAVKLLELPKSVGANPENNEEIIVSNGRYGPYIKCGSDTRTIPLDEMSPLTLTLEQALDLLKRPKTRGRAASQPKKLRELGKHPQSGSELVIKSGRYGPYVTDGTINASLPRGVQPEALSLDEAVRLLAERAEKIQSGGGKPARRKAAKGSKSKAAASKTSKKKGKGGSAEDEAASAA
ncbi:MAG: type I DNA topoisomerase, partial [Proteobacteria bacterium]